MTDTKWYETHSNVVELARRLNDDCFFAGSDEAGNVISYFAEPWKWTDEWDHLQEFGTMDGFDDLQTLDREHPGWRETHALTTQPGGRIPLTWVASRKIGVVRDGRITPTILHSGYMPDAVSALETDLEAVAQ